ncbi:hypothetical protein M422DRAFT_276510 [Sphaerobolus stellatus SS14]|uniref:Uncharacterized protein n=1 Tax=Sphaerobolus stellatus (strain SS14) TaxID=990650 RepID=A0A0C9TMD9_SPHS4|nr:hypothetical protein M422DRAFT_276510 [Sphaerobolus stellatus SS14]
MGGVSEEEFLKGEGIVQFLPVPVKLMPCAQESQFRVALHICHQRAEHRDLQSLMDVVPEHSLSHRTRIGTPSRQANSLEECTWHQEGWGGCGRGSVTTPLGILAVSAGIVATFLSWPHIHDDPLLFRPASYHHVFYLSLQTLYIVLNYSVRLQAIATYFLWFSKSIAAFLIRHNDSFPFRTTSPKLLQSFQCSKDARNPASDAETLAFVEEQLGLPASEGFGYLGVDIGNTTGLNMRYRIVRKLGFGRSSTAWMGHDNGSTEEGTMNKYVVKKIMKAFTTRMSEQESMLEKKFFVEMANPSRKLGRDPSWRQSYCLAPFDSLLHTNPVTLENHIVFS